MTRTNAKANIGRKSATRTNASGVSLAEIVEFIALTRGKTVASVTNAERCAKIGEKMFTADDTPLRAYIRIDNSATLETYAEYRERRAAKAERKNANASAPNASAPKKSAPQADANAQKIADALELLRSAGIDVAALQAKSAPNAASVTNARTRSAASVKAKSGAKISASVKAPQASASAPQANASTTRGRVQNDREIATILKYCAKLGLTRDTLEKQRGEKLADMSVYPLRDVKNALRAQIDASKNS